MSSNRAPALMQREKRVAAVWGKEVTEYDMVVEIGDEESHVLSSPVVVDGDKLEIESALLDVGKIYEFEYLGTRMVLWKLASGAIDLFEIIEE